MTLAGNTTGANSNANTNAIFSGKVPVIVAFVVGLMIVPYAAKASPVFVNGVLLLILIGTVIGNSDHWAPYFATAFANAANSVSGKVISPPNPARGGEPIPGTPGGQ